MPRRKEIACVTTRVRAVVWGEREATQRQILVDAETKYVRGGETRYQRLRGMHAARAPPEHHHSPLKHNTSENGRLVRGLGTR